MTATQILYLIAAINGAALITVIFGTIEIFRFKKFNRNEDKKQ